MHVEFSGQASLAGVMPKSRTRKALNSGVLGSRGRHGPSRYDNEVPDWSPGGRASPTPPVATIVVSPAARSLPRLLLWRCHWGGGKVDGHADSGLDHRRAGDKTGTGKRGAANDVAIAWPADRGPILVAAYLSDSPATPEVLNSAHATLGLHLARELGLS